MSYTVTRLEWNWLEFLGFHCSVHQRKSRNQIDTNALFQGRIFWELKITFSGVRLSVDVKKKKKKGVRVSPPQSTLVCSDLPIKANLSLNLNNLN